MPANLSPLMLTAMRLVPIAVLWTIVVAEVFLQNDAIADINECRSAALGAAVIIMVTKSVIGTIIGG